MTRVTVVEESHWSFAPVSKRQQYYILTILSRIYLPLLYWQVLMLKCLTVCKWMLGLCLVVVIANSQCALITRVDFCSSWGSSCLC